MGLHTDPGRAHERWPSRGPLDHSADPEGGGPAAGPAAPDVVADVLESALGGSIAGADFFTTEVWTWRGLVTYYTVFVIDLASRRVQILGSTPHPEALFMQQIVRTLTMAERGAVLAPVLSENPAGIGSTRDSAVPARRVSHQLPVHLPASSCAVTWNVT